MKLNDKKSAIEVVTICENGEISEVKVREVLIPVARKVVKAPLGRLIIKSADEEGNSRVYVMRLSKKEETALLPYVKHGTLVSDDGYEAVSLLMDKARKRTKRKKRQQGMPSRGPKKRGEGKGLDWEVVPSAPLKRKSEAGKNPIKMMEEAE